MKVSLSDLFLNNTVDNRKKSLRFVRTPALAISSIVEAIRLILNAALLPGTSFFAKNDYKFMIMTIGPFELTKFFHLFQALRQVA